MAGVFLTRREISCSELSYLMNDYSIKMNSYIVEDDDEFLASLISEEDLI